jgi:hypothetical protein
MLLGITCADACGGRTVAATDPGRVTQPPIVQIYLGRCGMCHERVAVGTHSRQDLDQALMRHRKRLRLSPEQWTQLVDYLAAQRNRPSRETASVTASGCGTHDQPLTNQVSVQGR